LGVAGAGAGHQRRLLRIAKPWRDDDKLQQRAASVGLGAITASIAPTVFWMCTVSTGTRCG